MTQAIAAALIFFLWTRSANAAETTWGVLQRFGLGGIWAALRLQRFKNPSQPLCRRKIQVSLCAEEMSETWKR